MLSLLLAGMALATEAADTVTLLFAGDIMLGGKAGIEIQEKRDPFRHVAKLLGSADVRIGNLENPITDHAVTTPDKPFVFKAAPQSAEVLAHHFDVLSLANNHMGDYGEQGVLDTLLHLNQQQIKTVGGGKTLASAHHPGLFTVNGISLAILAYNDFFPRRFEAMEQRAGVAWCDEDEIIFDIHKKEIPLGYLKYLYASTLIFAALFELIRVSIIRARLIREDWVPVVDESGRVTGSVQYRRDHPKEERLMHPQVRLYFLENGMIYLQQRKADDINEPLLWDASLSRSVRMTESIDLVLNKYTKKLYNQDQQKFLFLTNYIYNGRFNDQYIYLFISCKTDELKPQKDEVFQTKWWTTRQIEDNLGKNIFTERFEKEYDILKRSGLLEQESCECECALRELVKNKNGQSSV